MHSKNNKFVLLVNLGSPKELNKKSVKEYLKSFLSDDLVVDIPKFFQQLILRAFILPFRPRKTLHAYEQIWTKEGSPLIVSTKKIAEKLNKKTNWRVETAMRYEDPSIENALKTLKQKGCNKLFVVPLYPHNAMATTITTEEEVKRVAKSLFYDPFFEKINFDKLIFTYHGIPKIQAKKTDITGSHCFSSADCCETICPGSSDCYKAHTVQASNKVAEELGLSDNQWEIAYQSRLGPGWLTPFTDRRLAEMPTKDLKSVLVVCPSFISDCLETLEEIEIRGRDTFFNSGGEKMTYIPCLNDSNDTINLLESLVLESEIKK